MKVCFETFGCRLNKAEALQMEAEYLAKGWLLTEKHSEADLFVVRGCSVTARAQYACEKLIEHLKRHYPNVPIRVFGCLEKKNSDKFALLQRKASRSAKEEVDSNDAESMGQAVPTRTARAYLKVQDGCSGKCSFCIVPKFRGSSVSEPFTALMDKAKRFIESGYHEIVVTGCNLSLFASEGKRLPELLVALAGIDSSCRIRLGSLEPGACALETVHAMAEHSNICRFLHVPIQSGSSRILTAMRRPYQIREVDTLVTTAIKVMPKLGLGCDLMTGFPDESDIDFNMTKGLVTRVPFNNAHIFPYSERPGTVAATLCGVIPKKLRSVRAHELAHITQDTRERFAKTFIGKTVEIVVEDEEKVIGWTSEYLRCEAVGVVPRKAVAKIYVNRVMGDRLYGKLV